MGSLFDNPIIVFIIIATLSTLFNRIKGNQQDEQKGPQRRPAPTPQREYVPESVPEVYKPVEIEKRTTKLEREFNQRRDETQKKLAELKALKEANEAKTRKFTELAQSRKQGTLAQKAPGVKRSTILANQNRLVEGIILSEVLGPPRARKRHTLIKNK